MEAVASGDEVALQVARMSILLETDAWGRRVELVDACHGRAEADVASLFDKRRDEVFDDLLLTVHRDESPAAQLLEIESMSASVESNLDAVVGECFPMKARSEASFSQDVDASLFEDSGAHSGFHMLA